MVQMIDVIQDFYNSNPYPMVYKGIENLYDLSVPEDIDYSDKDICIAGCGTCQAFLVHQIAPTARIMAVDVSETSIAMSKEVDRKYGAKNINYVHDHFENIEAKDFDLVISTGVLHHVENRRKFFDKAFEILKDGGIFSGMVYHLDGRRGIRELVDYFMANSFTIQDVRRYFEAHPNKYYEKDKHDNEQADKWLNPRFHEYTIRSLNQEIDFSAWAGCERKFWLSGNDMKLNFRLRK